ncbi:hypothetical protein C0J52_22605 [Blattella germanica]|nr:hypothetical protein C0J52_22605 [Blattella germanica]
MYGSDIENINLNIDTEMTWAYPDPDENRTIMYDLYKINYMYPINGTLAGFWDSERGIRFNLTQYKYARRQDLQGIKFTAGIAVR